jgi:hypothetical protein
VQWVQVSPGSFSSISATRNRNGDAVVYAIVAGGTLWVNDPTLNSGGPLTAQWAQVSAGSFSSISASRNADGDATVFALVAGGSLWINDPSLNPSGPPPSRWQLLSPSAFSSLGADSSGDVFAVLANDHSLWEFRHGAGWFRLPTLDGGSAQVATAS